MKCNRKINLSINHLLLCHKTCFSFNFSQILGYIINRYPILMIWFSVVYFFVKIRFKFKGTITRMLVIRCCRFSLAFLLLVSSISKVEALSAITVNTIIGTAPYFTSDEGITKIIDTDGLLSITLSDGTYVTPSSNTSSALNPIVLPKAGESIADIGMFIPVGMNTVELNTLVNEPYNYWGDDDGDGHSETGIKASGSLTLRIYDVNGNVVGRSDALNGCLAPYRVVLTNTAASLQTQYGNPNSRNYKAQNAYYYISPKESAPYTCWAQPNLQYTTSGYYDSSYSAWSPTKGFKLQDIKTPEKNFPTMGANGLFFNLQVFGALGSDVTYSKSPESSGINLNLSSTAGSQVIKVMLTGPRYGATANEAATAVPTTFTLYSDSDKKNPIYSFTINNWFIVRTEGSSAGYNAIQTYCDSLTTTGSSYSVPKISQLSNANDSSSSWTGGLTGQGNTYSRRIGGGLFAEWGSTTSSYYTNSDFYSDYYWSADAYNSYLHIVNSTNGTIAYTNSNSIANKSLCVK